MINHEKTLLPASSIHRYFLIFILFHTLLWTLLPFLVRYNLPLDSLEGALWGHQLEWGYDKNPYLNAWLTHFAIFLGGRSGWLIYGFSQLSVSLCMIGVYRLACRMVPVAYAFISTILLDSLQYFNFHAIDFNDNVLELSLWSLSTYFYYLAIRPDHENTSSHRIMPWIATGTLLGLGVMAKYYTLALIACMGLFIILTNEGRAQLKTRAPYFGLLAFLIITLPHILWLFSHEFITVTYMFARVDVVPTFKNHLYFPWLFFYQQFEVLIPFFVLFSLFLIGRAPLRSHEKYRVNAFDWRFLLSIGLGPFVLTLLLSLIKGMTLRAGWGMPLLSYIPLLCIMLIQPRLTPTRIRIFLIGMICWTSLLGVGYTLSLARPTTTTSANFPGKQIAIDLNAAWRKQFHTPLAYVAGSRWLVSNLNFYASDHPAGWIEWNSNISPWISVEKLKQQGAIFIWDSTSNETLPENIKKAFPTLGPVQRLNYDWHRKVFHNEPIQIEIAFLPPANKD